MKIKWNEYTWYSKLLAVLFFIGVLPAWTFYVGVQYEQTVTLLTQTNSVQQNSIERNPTLHPTSTAVSSVTDVAQCSDQTDVGMASCAEAAFQANDSKLNALYNEVVTSLNNGIAKGDSNSIAFSSLKDSLVKSEKSWIAYRDSYCTAQTGIDVETADHTPIGGSIAQIEYPDCQNQLTTAQIKNLENISW